MNKFNRVVLVVMDSVGIGALPDAKDFNDELSVNTLGNISNGVGVKLPNLESLGIGNLLEANTISKVDTYNTNICRSMTKGKGKDTLNGHWEMMGSPVKIGFKQYTDNGFPQDLISKFEQLTGRKVVANKAANGMQVIKEYYHEHMENGSLIVYTSADSTFQIAAHEDIVPIDELYKYCEIASDLVQNEEYNVARIIARPFIGSYEDFSRTSNRHDYAQSPKQYTVMEKLCDNNLDSIAIGKIADIFTDKGVSKKIKTGENELGVNATIEELNKDSKGLIFTNLVDFDSMYGHPRDPEGYAKCLEEFDARVPEILEALKDDDLLIITADHGNDPTFRGNDHTREYVPFIMYSKSLKGNNKLEDRLTLEDIGQTICENFDLEDTKNGTSFLQEIL